jgi:hypothetical protein
MLIPFFPKKEFAEYCAVNGLNKFKAEPIDLYEFIDEWLVGMKEDRVKPSIFPINKDSVMVVIDVLLRDLYILNLIFLINLWSINLRNYL